MELDGIAYFMDNPTLVLAKALIACPSISPDDHGTQSILIEHLKEAQFKCETMLFGPDTARVTNLWAIRQGRSENAPVLVFAGHTDVVPPGPVEHWTSPPFTPAQRAGNLYGRGAADMKSSIAAFIVATQEFTAAYPNHAGSIALLITSDEEALGIDGTAKVCETLKHRGQRLDYCIVGEPTSVHKLGDTIKTGRRGSLHGALTVHGIQGHIAYPHLARNPIHLLAPALNELVSLEWDKGNASFPPTSWQVSNIHAGANAPNIIPGALTLDFNFRFSTQSSPESLKERLVAVLEKHKLDYDLKWTLSGMPYLTQPGSLVSAMQAAIQTHTGLDPELSTTGGTSDGRFLATLCPQVAEFGPSSGSIHKVDEHVRVADLEPLKNIYLDILKRLVA